MTDTRKVSGLRAGAWICVALWAVFAVACEQAPPETRSSGEACVVTSECESNLCYAATCLEPDRDDDRDGLTNTLEAELGTDPFNYDSDGDGLSDFHEIPYLAEPADEDGDGVIDAIESLTAETGSDGSPADNDCLTDQKDSDNATPIAEVAEFRNLACCCFGPCDKFGVTENKELVAGGGDPIVVLDANACTEEVLESGDLGCVLNYPWVNADDDGDGVDNACDPCPSLGGWLDDDYPNDSDKDNVWDCQDNCPPVEGQDTWNDVDSVTGVQADTDGDGIGDACDPNIDGDAFDNDEDNCPYVSNPEQGDINGDGIGDACDPVYILTDVDGDGTPNLLDCAPEDAALAAISCGPSNTCGDNGCGGSCGTCFAGEACVDNVCVATCVPVCALGTVCGDDGCGGSCGACQGDDVCTDGQCTAACVPSCDAKTCGDDGCGGSCGACGDAEVCGDDGQCEVVCTPNCGAERACGDDGCGGSCGGCDDGDACTSDSCEGGLCVYLAVTCEDFEPCKTATCDAEQGCVYTPQAGVPCEDGDPITFEERCSAEGACVAAVCAAACADNENCVGGVCAACTSVDTFEPEAYEPSEVLLNPELVGTMVELGVPVTRSLCPVDEEDWFRVAVGADTVLTVNVTSPNAEEMANIWLHVQVGGSAFSVTSLSNLGQPYLVNEVIEVDDDQDVVMRIESWDGQHPLDAYTLTVTICEPQCVGVACGDDGCGGSCGVCADGDACTEDACVDGACVFESLGCDDGDACTIDMCMDGECFSGPSGMCDDGDPCTVDTCLDGVCDATPMTCNDGDDCTADVCVAGECTAAVLMSPGCGSCITMMTDGATLSTSSLPKGDMVIRGAWAWIATKTAVATYPLADLQQGGSPEPWHELSDSGTAQLAQVSGGVAVGSGTSLYVWNTESEGSPELKWSGNLDDEIVDLVRRGGRLAVLHPSTLAIYEFVDEGGLWLMTSMEVDAGQRFVAFKGQDNLVLVGEGDNSAALSYYALTDASPPTLESQGGPVGLTSHNTYGVEVSQNVAYVATGDGLERVNLGDTPTWRDIWPMDGGAVGVTVVNGEAHLLTTNLENDGVEVVDVSLEEQMNLVGFFPLSTDTNSMGVHYDAGTVYVVADDGVHSLALGCGEVCADALDNNADGLIDCEDPLCTASEGCTSCVLDPLPTPEPVEQGEDPDDVTAFCFQACNDMVACSFGLLGGAPALCFPAFQACPEEFMAVCEPECVAEVTSDPRSMTSWRCRADVSLSGACPQNQLETWDTPEVCQLPEGECPVYDSGCNAWCAEAHGCDSVSSDTQGTLDSRIDVFQYGSPICELTCAGHALFNSSFGLFTQCLAQELDSESCNFSDLDYQACGALLEAECGNGSVMTGVEECDDNNTTTETCAYGETECTVCNASCQLVAGETSYCGDGDVQQGVEQCDDGNSVDGDGCSVECVEEETVDYKLRLRLEAEATDDDDWFELRVYVTDLRDEPTGVQGLEFALFAGIGGYIKEAPPEKGELVWHAPYDGSPVLVADLPKDFSEAQGGHLSFPLAGVSAGDDPVGPGEFLVMTMVFKWDGDSGSISSQASSLSLTHSMALDGEVLPVSPELIEFGSVDLFP